MLKSRIARVVISAFVAVAMVAGTPKVANADEVSITSVSGADASYVTYSGNTWTVSICDKTNVAKKGYVQVKSGKKWKKLTKVSKTKTINDVAQCGDEYPFLTEFTYSETKVGSKKYRVFVPGKKGYKLNFTVLKDSYAAVDSGGSPSFSSSKIQNCTFNGKRLSGSVYFTPYSLTADMVVYASSIPLAADLNVYMTPYRMTATSCGVWYETPYSLTADFVVYLSPYELTSDFTIYYTSSSMFAGQN